VPARRGVRLLGDPATGWPFRAAASVNIIGLSDHDPCTDPNDPRHIVRERRVNATPDRAALVLFAHGARDARWAEPFLRVAAAARACLPDRDLALAYLEFMSPDLATAVRQLAERGAREIRIVPLFFGRGGHLRSEVPRLVAEIAAQWPEVTLSLGQAAGDSDKVVEALAAFCVAEAQRSGER
jgi:sirohydrochlorin cobaltochelatase